MKKLLIALIPVIAIGTGLAHAEDKACTPADAKNAEKAVDRVVNWEQLYKAFKDYGRCDQGPVAEIFSDALLRCAVEWKAMEGLAGPMEKDSSYRDFVQRHLKTASKADADAVYIRAKQSCPKGLDTFCTDIAKAARPMAQFQTLELGPSPGTAAPKK
jgi:hypothetical protein